MPANDAFLVYTGRIQSAAAATPSGLARNPTAIRASKGSVLPRQRLQLLGRHVRHGRVREHTRRATAAPNPALVSEEVVEYVSAENWCRVER